MFCDFGCQPRLEDVGATDILETRDPFSHSQVKIPVFSSLLCAHAGDDRKSHRPSLKGRSFGRVPDVLLLPGFRRVAGLRASRPDLRPAPLPRIVPSSLLLCRPSHTGHPLPSVLSGTRSVSSSCGPSRRSFSPGSCKHFDVRLRRASIIAAARRRLRFALGPLDQHTGPPHVSLPSLHDPSPPGDPIGSIHQLYSRRRT